MTVALTWQASMGTRGTFFLLLFAAALMLARPLEAASAGDGALAKVGSELRALYEAYRVAQEHGRPMVLPGPSIRLVEDRVIIDAVATSGVEELKDEARRPRHAGRGHGGRIVSGQLPIAQIAAMAALPELRFARAAMSTTH